MSGPPLKNPYVALLLSALIVPGLGQILSGRAKIGALMMACVAVWLPVMVLKFIADLGEVWPGLIAKGVWTMADFRVAMSGKGNSLAMFMAPLVGIWFWTVTDAIYQIVLTRMEPPRGWRG